MLLRMLGFLMVLAVSAFGQLRFESRELVLQPSFLDKEVLAEFRFTNIGKAPVAIKVLSSSCDCTAVSSDKPVYAPGEQGVIRAVLTIGDRLGLQEKNVHLETDCPEKPTEDLLFKATIPSWVDLEPKMLKWAETETLEPKSVRVKIAGALSGPIMAEVSNPALAVVVKGNGELVVTPSKRKLRALVTLKGTYSEDVIKRASVFIHVQ